MHFVAKYVAGVGAIVGNDKVYRAAIVVPVKVDAEEYVSVPVYCVLVFFRGVIDEVLGIRFVGVLNCKNVYNEANMYGVGFVMEETWGAAGGDVTVSGKVSGKFSI